MIFGRPKSAPERIEKLVIQVQDGDKNAFGKIYDHFVEQIYRFIYFKVGEKETAEDLTQTVFLKALERIGSYRRDSQFASWLFAITRNSITDYFRGRKTKISLDKIAEPEVPDNTQALEVQEDVDQLLKIIRSLGEDEQEIIVLNCVEQYNISEIAQMTDKTENNLRVLKHRALKKIKEKINNGK